MITLITYTEGCFGEFMCSSISSDDNYYKGHDSEFVKNRNSYKYYDILKEEFNSTFDIFNLKYPCDFKEEILEKVKERYNEKHICARTHSYNFNFDWDPILNSKIMKINKVRMFATEEQYVFTLFMVMMKAHMPAGKVEDGPMWPLKLLTDKDSLARLPNKDYSFLDDADPDQFVNYIKWQTLRCRTSEKPEEIELYLNDYFQWYKNDVIIGEDIKYRKPNWTYLNVYDLMTKPEEVVEEWKEKLDLANVFDINRIKQYHANNVKMLYDQYNLTPEQLNEVNWKKILIDRALSLYDIPLKKLK